MNHYFSEKQEVKSDRKIIKYKIENKNFEFVTDNGVFSKTKVDFGTDVMLKVFLRENSDKKSQKFDILDIGCGYGVVSVVIKSFFDLFDIFIKSERIDLCFRLDNAVVFDNFQVFLKRAYQLFNLIKIHFASLKFLAILL